MGPFAAFFEAIGAESAASSAASTTASSAAASSAATTAASTTAASTTAASTTAATTAAEGITIGQALEYAYAGATLLQGVSAYSSGNTNAAYLKEAGRQAKMVGAGNKNLSDARGRAQLGEMRAQVGAQGTTFSGSPMLVYLDSVRNAAIESATEYYKGEIGATGYKEQARWAKRGGEADLWSGIIGASAPAMKSLGSRLLA